MTSLVDSCVACRTRGTGMVAIFRHPNGLDQMFHSVTGIEVENDDHLCIPCYDDLKTSYVFKQKCVQNNILRVSRPSAAGTSGPVKNTSDEDEEGAEEEFIEMRLESDADEDVTPKGTKDDVNKVADGDEQNNKENETDGGTESEFGLQSDSRVEIVQEEELVLVERRKSSKTEAKKCDEEEAEAEVDEQKAPAATKLPRVHNLMCRYCFREFTALAEKVTHEESHRDDPKPFKCFHGDCGGSFKDRVGLRSHVRLHSAVKRYKCRFCPMRFHQCSNHLAHERTHNGDKPFVCPHCGKGFAENGNLKNHIRYHTNERPYSCTLCRKTFRTHYSKTIHDRSHSGERPFLCNQCGKGFYSSGKLVIHQRIHTGERPYKCATCSARFVEKGGLRRHLKTH